MANYKSELAIGKVIMACGARSDQGGSHHGREGRAVQEQRQALKMPKKPKKTLDTKQGRFGQPRADC